MTVGVALGSAVGWLLLQEQRPKAMTAQSEIPGSGYLVAIVSSMNVASML
ncbi:hypothetical protein [Glutamicibacter uratoxydans]|nr:hypothetical protein [Glutamicibacter uratoxydans]